MKVRLNNVRLAFPHLFEPQSVQGEGDPAFSASFLLAPDHPDVLNLRRAMAAVAKEKWGDTKGIEIAKQLKAKDKTCLHDGKEKAEKYDGFEGMLYVSSRSKTRPTVIDQLKNPLTAQDGKPYGGCFVNGVVDVYAQDNQYGKRINAQLAGVQYVRDGDAFGGGRPADPDDFDEIAVEGEAGNDPWADDDVPKAAGDDLV